MLKLMSAPALLRDDRSCEQEDDRDARQDARIDLRSGSRIMKIVIDADALEGGDSSQRPR